jgi:hypothetical protein
MKNLLRICVNGRDNNWIYRIMIVVFMVLLSPAFLFLWIVWGIVIGLSAMFDVMCPERLYQRLNKYS